MRAVERRTPVRGQRSLGRTRQRHVVVVLLLLQGREGWWLCVAHLGLLFLLAALSSLHDLSRPVLVRRMVKQRANVVHEKRVE